METSTTQTITLPVTLAGTTRPVAFTFFCGKTSGFSRSATFTARIGRGAKTHHAAAQAVICEDKAHARRLGYQTEDLIEQDGQLFAIKFGTVVLNRQARITGWAEDAAATSLHIMEV